MIEFGAHGLVLRTGPEVSLFEDVLQLLFLVELLYFLLEIFRLGWIEGLAKTI